MGGLPAEALRYYAPSPALRPYVTNLFAWTGRNAAFEAWMPAIEAQLFFRIDGLVHVRFAATPDFRVDRPMLVGPMGGTMHIETSHDLMAVGCGLTAAGYIKLIGAAATGLRDRATELAALWGDRDVRYLLDLLGSAQRPEVRAGFLDTWLRTRIEREPRRSDWRAGAFDAWLSAGNAASLATIHDRLGLSARQTDRLARDMLGLSPKSLAMRQRALRAAEQLAGERSAAAAMTSFGYFDQSHMIRDFSRFIGATPGSFLATDVALHVFEAPERAGASLTYGRE